MQGRNFNKKTQQEYNSSHSSSTNELLLTAAEGGPLEEEEELKEPCRRTNFTMLILNLGLGSLLLLLIFQVVSSSTLLNLVSYHQSSSEDLINSSSGPLRISVYLKNYAGKPIRTILETEDPQPQLVATLPKLSVEDHIWEGLSITVECWSDTAPVMWESLSPRSSPSASTTTKVTVTTERRAPSFYDQSTYKFGAIITLTSTSSEQTGEYLCRPVNPEAEVTSSIFLFVPGKNLFLYNNNNNNNNNGEIETVQVIQDANLDFSGWVTLPCSVSDMNATIQLRKEPEGTMLPIGDNLTYDPMEGFRLKWRGVGALKDPWGEYTCLGKNSKGIEEKKVVKLVGPHNNAGMKRRMRPTLIVSSRIDNDVLPLPSNSKVILNYNKGSKMIECCSTSTRNQNLIVPRRRGISRQLRNTNRDLPGMTLSPCVSIADCYFSMSKSRGDNNKEGTSSQYSNNNNKGPSSDSFVHRLNDSCVGYELPEIHEAGTLRCRGQGEVQEEVMQFSYEPGLGLTTDFDTSDSKTPTPSILFIGREQSTSSKSSSSSFYCRANSFFFSNGIKWAVQVQEEGGGGGGVLEFLNDQDGRTTLLPGTVDEGRVTKVYCFAPIWDSPSRWRNVSIQL